MSNHVIEVGYTVTNADGSPHSNGHMSWSGLSDDVKNHMMGSLQSLLASANLHKNLYGGADSANLTTTLTGSLDGVAMPPVTHTGVSYKAMVKQERAFHDFVGNLITAAEELVSHKK